MEDPYESLVEAWLQEVALEAMYRYIDIMGTPFSYDADEYRLCQFCEADSFEHEKNCAYMRFVALVDEKEALWKENRNIGRLE